MIAAITQRTVRDSATGEIRDALCHDWYPFLKQAGFACMLPIPNDDVLAAGLFRSFRPDVVILSGGNDVAWGQPADEEGDDLSRLRDRAEVVVLQEAIDRDIPVLAVCRGMQMTHAFFGGLLGRKAGHARTVHSIRCSGLSAAVEDGRLVEVNSFHNIVIEAESVPDELAPFAFADDGTVEAFVHRSLPITGIMWHPERPGPSPGWNAEILRLALAGSKRGGK